MVQCSIFQHYSLIREYSHIHINSNRSAQSHLRFILFSIRVFMWRLSKLRFIYVLGADRLHYIKNVPNEFYEIMCEMKLSNGKYQNGAALAMCNATPFLYICYVASSIHIFIQFVFSTHIVHLFICKITEVLISFLIRLPCKRIVCAQYIAVSVVNKKRRE